MTTSSNLIVGILQVSKALDEVSKSIFPVRALELQKLWMQKVMKKPYNLRIRQTVAAIGRLNNDLPFYPGGSASSKFETREIISIIEWCVPEDYRIKMNEEGWIPAEHSMPEFITKLETIEAYLKTIQLKEEAKKGRGRIKKQGGFKRKNDDDGHKEYYCAYHGTNPSHSSKQCKVLKAQREGGDDKRKQRFDKKKNFSSKLFKKELNTILKTKSKKEILAAYMATLKQEIQLLDAALNKTSESRSKSTNNSDDNSDNNSDNNSVLLHHLMEINDPDANATTVSKLTT